MKTKINYLYDCSFKSSRSIRQVKVVADSFGRAASLAHCIASGWDDAESFELSIIHLLECVVVLNN